MKIRSILVLALAILVLLSACSSGAAVNSPSNPSSKATGDGTSLLQERCTACHPLSRVESARFSSTEWKVVVDTMISRGAQLTTEEENSVVNYLAANFGQ